MPQFQSFTNEDKIVETTKVTKGFFTGDIGTLAGSSFVTASLTADQKEYYYNLQNTSADQFSVTYGHWDGSGSNDTVGQTQAIYKYFGDMLLFPEDMESNGFQFDGSTKEKDVWFFVAERARMKDRVNRKNWTIHLSGSSNGGASPINGLSLTDDSKDITSTPSPVGPRYNIVSGTLGSVVTPAATKTYGWFYPNVGIMAFSGTQLSASIRGDATTDMQGFAPDVRVDGNADNAYKFVHAVTASATGVTMRNEEDQITTSYFIRARARDWNFSNNPTFGSGSDYTFAIREFTGNPQTFITTVGLYDAQSRLVAVGRLSTPVLKNFSTEAVMKVNLTY